MVDTFRGESRCRIGIDVGGTFTDLVLADHGKRRWMFFKEPSVPNDPSAAVERGIAGILNRAEVKVEDVELVVHGTTLGLNTIIQRTGAKIALVVSEGNRDVLELARCRMPSSYDLRVGKEVPLVPRNLVFEVSARVLASGVIDRSFDPESIKPLAQRLRSEGVSAVAVMLLNSYLYPDVERQVVEALQDALPGLLVTGSADLWPEIREYERALVTTLNAYIHPQLDAYLSKLRDRLNGMGLKAPIYITGSNGGTLGLETARNRPIDTVLSGPASGVVAAARLAASAGLSKLITFDMGGTSSDMAVSSGGQPEQTTRTTVGDFPLILPVVNVSAIGAGGGSIVWVDPQGLLKVGPESAGADPGPVCYGKGAIRPTITDCFLTLGYMRADGFLGGRMTLDRAAAIRALDGVAERLGLTGAHRAMAAAEAAVRVATAKMSTELHKSFAQRGLDPRDYALVAYGGAGPTQANHLAEEVRVKSILIPPSPGTLCALGAILAELKRDFLKTVRQPLTASSELTERLRRLVDEVKREADDWLAAEGGLVGTTQVRWTADMKYTGQAYELQVDTPEAMLASGDVHAIVEAFHGKHLAVYGYIDAGSAVDMASLRAQVTGTVPSMELTKVSAGAGSVMPEGHRKVFLKGEMVDVPVFSRARLRKGNRVSGPAIIEQEDTTTVILTQWSAIVDEVGSMLISKNET